MSPLDVYDQIEQMEIVVEDAGELSLVSRFSPLKISRLEKLDSATPSVKMEAFTEWHAGEA